MSAGLHSIAVQDMDKLGGRRSVLWRQKRDHVLLDRLLRRLTETKGAKQELVLLETWRLGAVSLMRTRLSTMQLGL